VELGSDYRLKQTQIDGLLRLVVIMMATTMPEDGIEFTFA
jgi:hypothetical protein